MEFKETNICIVGAGPAGLSAAIKLAQEGLAVTVVDRHKFPRDKVCGDALSVYAKACIKKLDADLFRDIEESAYCLKYERLKIYGPSGNEINIHLNSNNPERYGFVSRRLHLDSILFEFARKIEMPILCNSFLQSMISNVHILNLIKQ
jgi:flavin-dependent dehydrogenase